MSEGARRSMEVERVPQLAPGWEEKAADLTPEEGFLLSRIDGHTSWEKLRSIAGLPPERVDGCLARWERDGLVRVGLQERPARESEPEAPAGVDPSLEIPTELQGRILEFEQTLERPYHEILGVGRDADAREIKRAYFRLSKVFHPDRYFQRRIGPFAERLDRIFKKVALAYELLSDPATRAELERSLESAPPPPSPGAPPKELTKRQWLERVRRRFRIPEEVLAERRFRAKQLGEAAVVAQHQRRWNEAASCIRLAIAFDPWTDAYKRAFGEILAEVNQERATRLLEEAGGAWDARSQGEALRLFEEVIHYRPGDAEVHDRAARVAMELDDFERARDYAERACELAPEVAGYALTLGRALRRLGLRERAKKALERARQLDPRDDRIQQELARVRPRPGSSSGGML